MSDEETVVEETPAPAPTAEGSDTEPAVDLAKEAEKWKAIARKHEERAKANAEAAARLKEMEDAGKTEAEKLQSALAEAQAQARKSTVKALKLEVANEKGLPASLAKFLPDTENEVDMMQAADELLEASGAGLDTPTKRPKSQLSSPLGSDSDPADDAQRMLNSMLGRPS